MDLYPEDWEPGSDDAVRGIGRLHGIGMLVLVIGLIGLAILGIYLVSQLVPFIWNLIPFPPD